VIFGAIDTGLLAISPLCGGLVFDVAGAVAAGVVGDALTDSVARFFGGNLVVAWQRGN